MARVRVLTAAEIDDPDLAAMARASGDEMYGVFGWAACTARSAWPMTAASHAALRPDGA